MLGSLPLHDFEAGEWQVPGELVTGWLVIFCHRLGGVPVLHLSWGDSRLAV